MIIYYGFHYKERESIKLRWLLLQGEKWRNARVGIG
jgi:hypothetical protein